MTSGVYIKSAEHRKKLSEANKGKAPPMTGKKHSEESKRKMSEWQKGKRHSEEYKKNMSRILKGRIFSEEHRRKLSGERGSNWRGGITPINHIIRSSLKYRLVRKACFERDNYTCIWCFQKGGRLNADHIKPFALFPEFRFALNNLRTLCEPCHKKTDTYGRKK